MSSLCQLGVSVLSFVDIVIANQSLLLWDVCVGLGNIRALAPKQTRAVRMADAGIFSQTVRA